MGMQAFTALRTQAKENGVQDLTLELINDEIHKSRYGEDTYLVTGNTKHFPSKPFVVTA